MNPVASNSNLSAEDYAQILSKLPELYVLRDLSELPATMLRILSGLIANVFCSYNELQHQPQNVVVVCLPDYWRDRMEPLMPEANRHLDDHPLYKDLHLTSECEPRTISDYCSEEDWKRSGFATAIMNPLGIGDSMIFRLNPGSTAMIFMCVNRSGWGYSPRDRQIASVLRSHFSAAHANAVAFTNVQAMALISNPASDLTTAGVVAIDQLGQILHINEAAVGLVGKYFKSASWGRTLPAPVQEWLSRDGSAGLPVSSLEEVSGQNRLSIRWSRHPNGSKILLLEEHAIESRVGAESFGLSRREAEVLHWISEGKNNPEIGKILSISVRTVEKHVEMVYHKLGVENRMGAILRVLSNTKRT